MEARGNYRSSGIKRSRRPYKACLVTRMMGIKKLTSSVSGERHARCLEGLAWCPGRHGVLGMACEYNTGRVIYDC